MWGLALGGEEGATLTVGAVESLAGKIEMRASRKASWKRLGKVMGRCVQG